MTYPARTLVKTGAILAAACLIPVITLAAPPEPRRAVDPAFFTGRWYEIARSDNERQRNCQAPTYQFEPRRDDVVAFALTCRQGSPAGRAEVLNVTIRLPPGEARNKFRVTALGGLVGVDYWVLDIDPALSWAILATADGKLVWLLARRPSIDPALKTRLLNQIDQMGYDRGKIVEPLHG